MNILFALLLASSPFIASGPFVSKPPSGDNQRAIVTQQIGPVTVSVEYSSPRVVLKGDDRRGKIWGGLVPYGLADLGFNNCKKCPWRAGANENTIFTASTDVKIQGQALPAGKYGLFMIPGKDEFTVIFSKNTSSWGSFFYDPKEEALRVTTKPSKSEYHEWLTYEFTEREPAKATVALKWDELQVPFTVTVENAPAIYVAQMKEQLRGEHGFDPQNYQIAVDYCLKNKVALPDALAWAERGVNPQVGGQENFTSLMTLSRAQAANGLAAESAKTQEKALADPGTKPLDIHQLGRALLGEGKKQEALKIFQINAQRFPDKWPVHVGLMRGYAANGDTKRALEEAQLGLKQAPDEGNRKNIENAIKLLQDGKKID
jgi:tetratricopeptide (TPR) repeat protein